MDNTGSCADLYDLHLHTYWSYDATANPENYFRRAREIGVRCLAIADHHVLDSLEEVMEIARRDIAHSRKLIHHLMDEQLIPEFPTERIQDALDKACAAVRGGK